ncbi:MAG: DUF1549 and DUF1553 domain-containing protein [Planctomycetia bacterium]|nr:DUF1549 and DUF1553 domain-containing protein [Planctomycetia bacterium]
MLRRHAIVSSTLTLLIAGLFAGIAAAQDAPGSAESTPVWDHLDVSAGLPDGEVAKLKGADARQQLLVTGVARDGALSDLTRRVQFFAEPAGVVSIDPTGLVTPLADGEAMVLASLEGVAAAKLSVLVEGISNDLPINFPNQIVPIFTKFGCNGGGCHGKASGQNGFKLSLLGFEPTEDYEHLVKESRGRRVFPAAPDRSLLLTKPINASPHGGGQRMQADSHEYRLMRRWISQGMPYGKDSDPKVTAIEVVPPARSLGRDAEQQLIVLAKYSDGTVEDVTRMTQFTPNDTEMSEVTVTGLVKTLKLTGDVAVMCRYQGQVTVFRATIPLGAPVETVPPVRNFVDDLVFNKLHALGMPPSTVCDDATFIRRAALDIAGRTPTPEEVLAFSADTRPDKRDRLVDTFLDDPNYADFFANKWNSILRNKRRSPGAMRGSYAFHEWIRQALLDNMPYDEFVRSILTASGEIGTNPPVAWYREVKTAEQQVEDSAQLFLGLRIQCAKCHHHPFEKWSQRDYHGFAAFFSRVGRKEGMTPDEPTIYHRYGVASADHPKTGEKIPATGLDVPPEAIAAEDDPRHYLVDWMSDRDNRFFAPALVNRYWKHFFNRGLVDPEDDMRVTNPASNPELLDALAKHFIDSGFDLKDLVRTICRSSTYQLSSIPNEYNANDKQNYSRYYPRRLAAESLLDAIDLATGTQTKFGGLPLGTQAIQLPDSGANTYFLAVFGKPEADTACECERSQEANLAQSLHLLNSSEVQGKLSDANGRAAKLAADAARTPTEKVRELYLWVYSREPIAEELQVAVAHLEKTENKQQAYEDVLWALLNTKEFLFNH